MTPIPISAPQRGRRLLAAMISISALLAAGATLLGGPVPAHAETGENTGPSAPLKSHPASSPPPTPSPAPTPFCGADFNPDFCASPSPSVVVVSPVAPDPSPSNATPSYLIGTAPSPSPSQDGTNAGSSPPPLGGGFVDQLPTPGQQATTAPPSDLAPHQSGLPLPFLAVGTLLVLGAVGSLIYAVAPRQKNVFARAGQAPRPGPKKPA